MGPACGRWSRRARHACPNSTLAPWARSRLIIPRRSRLRSFGLRLPAVAVVVVVPSVPVAMTCRVFVKSNTPSPPGYIYYNSSQSGTMQLWRMKPDGSAKEQITFDEYNDWFPHISPDGKWIAFISFPTTISPNDHPSYKRVMLRLMPAGGGVPRVIAYLYGGGCRTGRKRSTRCSRRI